jgi:CHAD domain-containing protein
MAAARKWEIPGLDRERGIKSGACLILSHRLHTVIALSAQFRRGNDAEDLHQLRIAIRRLRYPLETFLPILKRKPTLKFIAELNTLQDACGNARDSDIMMLRLQRDRDAHGWRIARRIFADMQAERVLLYRQAADAIDLFMVSPLLYDFKHEISYTQYAERIDDALESGAMEASDEQPVNAPDINNQRDLS